MTRWRKMSQPNRTTQIGAVVAKKVALATLVWTMARCQKKRSPAKASPDRIAALENRSPAASGPSARRIQA